MSPAPRVLALALSFGMLAGCAMHGRGTSAAAPPPDMSGTWVADFTRSVGVPPSAGRARVVDVIRQTRDSIVVESLTTYPDGREERPPRRAYALDGTPTVWRYPAGRTEMVDVARFAGDTFVVHRTVRATGQAEYTIVDRTLLSADGSTMTCERVEAPGTPRERRLTLVAVRVP
jgi:hypothetical protein